MAELEMAECYQALEPLLFHYAVDVWQAVAGQAFVENAAADRGVEQQVDLLADRRTHYVLRVVLKRQIDEIASPTKFNFCLRFNRTGVEGEQNVLDRAEDLVVPLHLVACQR